MQKEFQLAMLWRLPFTQRFDLWRWRHGGHKATLGREESRIAHRRAVSSFHVALCQLREINFIEDRKRGELGNSVGSCDCGSCEQEHEQEQDRCAGGGTSRWSQAFEFHEAE